MCSLCGTAGLNWMTAKMINYIFPSKGHRKQYQILPVFGNPEFIAHI